MDGQKNKALTEDEQERFLQYADQYGPQWRDHASALVKWLLGALITVNTGGLFFATTANLHPEAMQSLYLWFFGGLAAALTAAAAEVFRSSRLIFLAAKVKVDATNLSEAEVQAIRHFFSSWRSALVPAFLCFASVFLLFMAGATLTGSMRPCTADDLKYSMSVEDNLSQPAPKAGSRHCYFYEIDGLSNDPLKRAIQEQELLRRLGTSTQPSPSPR